MTLTSSWANVHARARLVHILACGGANRSELVALAGGDPAVLVAAIVYESEQPIDYSIIPRVGVVRRLEDCLRALTADTAPSCDATSQIAL